MPERVEITELYDLRRDELWRVYPDRIELITPAPFVPFPHFSLPWEELEEKSGK